MTLVSIITPSLNQSAYLEQTMRSVLEQDYPELEYIVVDGGSTDSSREIIQKHAGQLAWWVSERDAGQADAINKGLGHARGEIVAWLNSDDYYLPGAISAAVRGFETYPAADLLYGNMLAVDALGRTLNRQTYRQLTLEDLLCFQIIGQPATFMRRRALIAAGGLDTNLHLLLDHQLWIRLARRGQIIHLDETLAAARFHAAAKNRAAASQFGSEAFRILAWASRDPDVGPVLRPIQRRARASAHRVDARYLLDAGEPRLALRAWGQALVTDPAIALARLNLLASALLELAGLGGLRRAILQRRRERLTQ